MKQKFPLGWVAVPAIVVALAGALAVLFAAGMSSFTMLLTILVLALGGGLGFIALALREIETNSGKAQESQRRDLQASQLVGLDQLCGGVLPVWSGQIETARSHTART